MDLHLRLTRKGKALVSRGKPSATAPARLEHDRPKSYPLPAGRSDEFLERLGLARGGKAVPATQDKFRQVNRFLELLSHVEILGRPRERAIHIIDCGCGRAFLTFAAYHYLKHLRGFDVALTGVDADAEVIAAAEAIRDRLGYDEVRLVRSRIADFEPESPPQAVLSLHACDTATDEALAQAVHWGAELILASPCCQHELHRRIARTEFRAALRHGILRERMADILTDALRAAALRTMSYRAEVIEFIEPEHTAKNLMIRAERAAGIPRRQAEAAAEYLRLRDFWGVSPAIERLLGPEFQRMLGETS